jgi:hypothetical protein
MGSGMTEEEAFAKGFIKGYETGLREAFDETIRTVQRKSFTNTELLLVVKNQRVNIPDKVLMQKRRLLKELGVDLITDRTAPALELEIGVAPGSSLFVKERTPQGAFRIFNQLVSQGAKGLIFSRLAHDAVRLKVGSDCEAVYWLTKFEVQNEDLKQYYIQPTDLGNFYTTFKKFLVTNKNVQTVVLLDGIQYLISNNDFNGILKSIQKMKDDIYMFHSAFIITADPASLNLNEVKQLENEMQNVIEK